MRQPKVQKSAAPLSAKAAKPGRIDALQVLRGLSAVLVLLYHACYLVNAKLAGRESPENFFLFGHGGLHLFFVLSGFIIYHVHEKDLGKPARLKPFLLKRAIRIYPVYWLLTLAVLPAFYFFPDAIKVYKQNFWYLVQTFALYPVGGRPIIPPAWSLSHELKFYSYFALAICLPARVARWFVGAITALSFGALIVLMAPGGDDLWERLSPGPFVSFLVHPLNLEFGAGVLCAWILKRYAPGNGTLVLGMGLALFSVAAIFDYHVYFNDLWQILGYGTASALILLGAAAGNFQSHSRVFRQGVFLGEASYSLYLIHFPLCTLACLGIVKLGIVKNSGLGMAILLLVLLSVLAACLFHWLVERPLLRMAHWWLLKSDKAA